LTIGGVSAGRTSGPTKAFLTLDPPQDINNERGEHDAETAPTRSGFPPRVRGLLAPLADLLDSVGSRLPTNGAALGPGVRRTPTRRALDHRSMLSVPGRHNRHDRTFRPVWVGIVLGFKLLDCGQASEIVLFCGQELPVSCIVR
jgi:hypothetical protein